MRKRKPAVLYRFAAFVMLWSAACTALHGQAHTSTASRAADLQVGGSYASTDSDYDGGRESAYGIYGTLDFKTHFGAEIAFHRLNGLHSMSETTYEIGGRYVRHYGIVHPYARAMYGRGVLNYTDNIANLAFNLFAFAGGADINVQRHVNVRAEFEEQMWHSVPPHGLTPNMITIGAAYHF
jgi:hypothetical protein